MTNIETMLNQYPNAKREIRDLEIKLANLMKGSQEAENTLHGYSDLVRVRTYKISDPTYEAARILCDHYAEEVTRCREELAGQKAIVNLIDNAINAAGLDQQESNYVKYRYLEGHAVDAVCELMHGISRTSAYRIRDKALEKIESVTAKQKAL
jgi:hypothetical protein